MPAIFPSSGTRTEGFPLEKLLQSGADALDRPDHQPPHKQRDGNVQQYAAKAQHHNGQVAGQRIAQPAHRHDLKVPAAAGLPREKTARYQSRLISSSVRRTKTGRVCAGVQPVHAGEQRQQKKASTRSCRGRAKFERAGGACQMQGTVCGGAVGGRDVPVPDAAVQRYSRSSGVRNV